jgi:hypothetical protein
MRDDSPSLATFEPTGWPFLWFFLLTIDLSVITYTRSQIPSLNNNYHQVRQEYTIATMVSCTKTAHEI